jgi:hypothetical protein
MTDTNKHARKEIAKKWPALSEDERVQLRSLWARAGVVCSVCGAVGYYREICPKGCPEPKQKKRKVFDSDSSSDDDADGGGGKKPVNAALSFGAVSEFTSAASGAKGYVNDTGLGVLWGAPGASVASSSSSRKKSEATAPSGLTHKQRYLADMRQRAQVRPRRRYSCATHSLLTPLIASFWLVWQDQQKRLAASDATIGSFEFFTKVRPPSSPPLIPPHPQRRA